MSEHLFFDHRKNEGLWLLHIKFQQQTLLSLTCLCRPWNLNFSIGGPTSAAKNWEILFKKQLSCFVRRSLVLLIMSEDARILLAKKLEFYRKSHSVREILFRLSSSDSQKKRKDKNTHRQWWLAFKKKAQGCLGIKLKDLCVFQFQIKATNQGWKRGREIRMS